MNVDTTTELNCRVEKKLCRADWLAIIFILVGLAAAVAVGAYSDGFYHDDDLTHYRYAKSGSENINDLLHRWARPGYNIPTAVVARYFDLPGCRIFSAVQTALVAFFAFLIARKLIGPGVFAAFAGALVWAQPMVFRLATTTLTETTAAVYLTVGVWLFLRGNRIWACVVISLVFVTRDETMALAPLMGLAVLLEAWRAGGSLGRVLKTRWVWLCAAALLWAPIAYFSAGGVLDLPPDGNPLAVFSREYSPEYGSGPGYWYLAIWPEAATIGIPALAIAGAIQLARRGWLISAWVFGLVALHSVIFTFGLFASGGYSRFLVPIAGLLAVLAASGAQGCWEMKRKIFPVIVLASMIGWLVLTCSIFGYVARPEYLLPVAAVLLLLMILTLRCWRNIFCKTWLSRIAVLVAVVLVIFQDAAVIRPLRLDVSALHRVVIHSVRKTDSEPYANRVGFSQHVLIQHLRPGTIAVASNEDGIDKWRTASPGSLFFWESKYCVKPHKPQSTQMLQDELNRLGRIVAESEDSGYTAIVYERIAQPG